MKKNRNKQHGSNYIGSKEPLKVWVKKPASNGALDGEQSMPKEEKIVLTDEEVKAGHRIRDGKKVYDPLERFQSDEQESLVEKGEDIFLTDEEIKAGFYIKDGKRVICPLVPFQSEKAVDGNNDIGDLEDASRINESEPCKNVEDECRESPSAYNTSEVCKGRASSDNKQPNLDVRTESVQYEIPYQNRIGQSYSSSLGDRMILTRFHLRVLVRWWTYQESRLCLRSQTII